MAVDALNGTVTGSPVSCRIDGAWIEFPIHFTWQTGAWFELFERHADYIKDEIRRRRAAGRSIFYLSCPISPRGGGFTPTNIEIALAVARTLEERFGRSFWGLNPVLFQMESRAGIGLIERHARLLSLEKEITPPLDLAALHRLHPVTGGDYLRMWSRVLVEDEEDNLGGDIDAYYFIGPKDVWSFFSRDGTQILDAVEDFLARKIVLDEEYHKYFGDAELGAKRRKDFVGYYTLKAGAAFSLGSHDELAVWETINTLRTKCGDAGAQIPAFSEGCQLNLIRRSGAKLGYSV